MKLIPRSIVPATEKQQTLDAIRNDPLIRYVIHEGQLFRMEYEQFD